MNTNHLLAQIGMTVSGRGVSYLPAVKHVGMYRSGGERRQAPCGSWRGLRLR